jgi:hypothetical protein
MPENLRQQMRVNAVALISLAVALSSLAYNTWRNERTEANRSVRVAAFEVLRNLGELQVIVNVAYFAKNEQLGNPMAGWGRVALISDLSQLLPAPAPEHAKRLVQVWQADWQQVRDDEPSVERITAEIDQSRDAVREILRRLD